MKPLIAVVDYGMGNLRSVEKALEKVGARVEVTDSAKRLLQARGVVLPGVGAFGEAVTRLKKNRLWTALENILVEGRPFLGICLGLQLLFERSEESPAVKGFGFLKGQVKRFKFAHQHALKVPHMGWNTLRLDGSRPEALEGIAARDFFYFVHSFYPAPKDDRWVKATTSYGVNFCSAVGGGALFASQFHPEKSGKQGLRILKNFVQQVGRC